MPYIAAVSHYLEHELAFDREQQRIPLPAMIPISESVVRSSMSPAGIKSSSAISTRSDGGRIHRGGAWVAIGSVADPVGHHREIGKPISE
jgi:hypothetical protein